MKMQGDVLLNGWRRKGETIHNSIRCGILLGCAAAALNAVPAFAQNDDDPILTACPPACDIAFLERETLRWHIDVRDLGDGCVRPVEFHSFWQHGLDSDLFFLAGEPAAGYRDGYDELIIVRPDNTANPMYLHWYVKFNDQMPGYTGNWVEFYFGFWDDHPFIINRSGADHADRIAVKQGRWIIVDTNGNGQYDSGPDEFYEWDVDVGADARLFASDVLGPNAGEDLILWHNGYWKFYRFDLGQPPSESVTTTVHWGMPGDIPMIGDINSDGHEDLLLFRPSNNHVYVNKWEQGAPEGGYGGASGCTLNYSSLLDGSNYGWRYAVALNFNRGDDSDGDGVCDEQDGCPNDPNKIEPEVCGCGESDRDSDDDETPDCIDLCPNDPNKIVPGECGCGKSDRDSDGDEVPDECGDNCPYDPNKTEPGVCGCGTPDEDNNNNGVIDCLEHCPGDVDDDKDVDLQDLSLLLASYGRVEGDLGFIPETDLDYDGDTDASDLAILLGCYGNMYDDECELI